MKTAKFDVEEFGKCPHCGKSISAKVLINANYCIYCGKELPQELLERHVVVKLRGDGSTHTTYIIPAYRLQNLLDGLAYSYVRDTLPLGVARIIDAIVEAARTTETPAIA